MFYIEGRSWSLELQLGSVNYMLSYTCFLQPTFKEKAMSTDKTDSKINSTNIGSKKIGSKKVLLVIAHAPSENTNRMLQAVIKGASHPDLTNITVKLLAPLDTQVEDIKSAHAIIIGTTENLGYMAGLIKDVFDRTYYGCLDHTQAMPFSFYIRAGHDGTGTKRGIETITTGLRWKLVQEPLMCTGDFNENFINQCEELGLTMAASLDAGII